MKQRGHPYLGTRAGAPSARFRALFRHGVARRAATSNLLAGVIELGTQPDEGSV